MKKPSFKTLFLSFILIMSPLFSSSLSALFIGKLGDAITLEERSWQPMRLEDGSQGITALFPESPSGGIQSGWYFIYSSVEGTIFEIHTHATNRYVAPSSQKEFMQTLLQIAKNDELVFDIDVSLSGAQFGGEIQTFDQEGTLMKRLQILFIQERAYYAIVEGKDELGLADSFFESVQFYSIEK